MQNKINIAIAEDHLLIREGMISLLERFPEISVSFDVNNGKELLNNLKKTKPDIILLDVEMPIMDGRTALNKIKQNYPNIKVIVISSYFNDSFIVEFVRMGAVAFLPKNCDIGKVVEAIHAVYNSGNYFDSNVSAALAKVINQTTPLIRNNINNQLDLTNREVQIIRLISANLSNKQISAKLNISVRTVEGHRANIRLKTGCQTVLDFSNYVHRFGLANLM